MNKRMWFILGFASVFALPSYGRDSGDRDCNIFVARAALEMVQGTAHLNSIVVVKRDFIARFYADRPDRKFNVHLMKLEMWGGDSIAPYFSQVESDRLVFYFSKDLGITDLNRYNGEVHVVAYITDQLFRDRPEFNGPTGRIFDNNEEIYLKRSNRFEHAINHCN